MTCICDCNKISFKPEMVSVSEFTPEIQAILTGVPAAMAERYAVEAAIIFARDTQYFRREQVIKPQSCVADYYIKPFEGEQVSRIYSACADGVEFIANRGELCGGFCYFSGLEWSFAPPLRFNVYPTPKSDCDDCILVTYTAMPTRGACEVDAEFSTRFHNAIVTGAVSKIMMHQGDIKAPHSFSNPRGAQMYASEFRGEIAAAKSDVMRQFSRGTQSTLGYKAMQVGF